MAGLVVEERDDQGLVGQEGGCGDQGTERGERRRWHSVNSEELLKELMVSELSFVREDWQGGG